MEDNSTLAGWTGLEQSSVVYGPALPPHSLHTKVGLGLKY